MKAIRPHSSLFLHYLVIVFFICQLLGRSCSNANSDEIPSQKPEATQISMKTQIITLPPQLPSQVSRFDDELPENKIILVDPIPVNTPTPLPTKEITVSTSTNHVLPMADENSKQMFVNRMDSFFNTQCGDWHVIVKKVNGEIFYTRNHHSIIHPASVIKIPIAMLFLKWLEDQHIADPYTYIKTRGISGRTYYQLLRAMVVFTEELATLTLNDFLNKNMNTSLVLKNWGLKQTKLKPRSTTVEEMAMIFENLYTQKHLSSFSTQLLLELMEEYTPNDNSRIGAIRPYLPKGYHIYNKRGSLTQGMVVVADAAILVTPIKEETGEFIIQFFGSTPIDNKKCTYDVMDETIKKSSFIFYDYLYKGNIIKKYETQ